MGQRVEGYSLKDMCFGEMLTKGNFVIVLIIILPESRISLVIIWIYLCGSI